MAVEIVRQEIRPAERDEYIVLMDDYGAELHIALPVTFTPEQRAAAIAAKTAAHAATQAQLEAYSAAAKVNLSAHKVAGLAKRSALQKRNGIAPVA